MSCPACGSELEDYSDVEGGWCPQCKEWCPADITKERLEEGR